MAECEVNNTEEEEEKSRELYLEKDQEEIVEEVVDDAQSACKAFIILASPQKCELEQEVQSLFINGACHENQEVDWNLLQSMMSKKHSKNSSWSHVAF